jgi:hypothetical protein
MNNYSKKWENYKRNINILNSKLHSLSHSVIRMKLLLLKESDFSKWKISNWRQRLVNLIMHIRKWLIPHIITIIMMLKSILKEKCTKLNLNIHALSKLFKLSMSKNCSKQRNNFRKPKTRKMNYIYNII